MPVSMTATMTSFRPLWTGPRRAGRLAPPIALAVTVVAPAARYRSAVGCKEIPLPLRVAWLVWRRQLLEPDVRLGVCDAGSSARRAATARASATDIGRRAAAGGSRRPSSAASSSRRQRSSKGSEPDAPTLGSPSDDGLAAAHAHDQLVDRLLLQFARDAISPCSAACFCVITRWSTRGGGPCGRERRRHGNRKAQCELFESRDDSCSRVSQIVGAHWPTRFRMLSGQRQR